MVLKRLSLLIILGIAPVLLVSCGPSPNALGPGGVTKAQAEELNEAAASLDQRTRDAEIKRNTH